MCAVGDYGHDGLASYYSDQGKDTVPGPTVKSSWMRHEAYTRV
jgi:hypothetical protein